MSYLRRSQRDSASAIATVIIFCTACFLTPTRADAQNADAGWIGKRVFPKSNGFRLWIDNRVVEASRKSLNIYRVDRVNGPWLWLYAPGVEGWGLASEVVDVDQAIDFFTTWIRANPGDAWGYHARSIIWMEVRKDLDLAMGDINEKLRLSPFSAAFNSRGIIWSVKKEYDNAIADYNEAIRLDPKEASPYNNRGISWDKKKEYDKAIADYNEAIRLDPKYAAAYYNRGNAWRDKKDYDKAIADYNEAIRLDPKYAAAYNNRGNAWDDKKEYDKAIADYNEAIRLDPKFVYAYFNRSVVGLITGGDFAVSSARTAFELDGGRGDRGIYASLISHFAARRLVKNDEANKFLAVAKEKCDASAWPYPVVKFLLGELNETSLVALATDDDKKTEAHCFIGLDQEIKGQTDSALEHFRWVKEHGNPTFTEYTIAIAEIDRLMKTGKK
jgi:tetratricopeptide (TPR) repeat protein